MRNFLQILMIVLALCLCGLVAAQWVREAHMRQQLESFAKDLHDKNQKIQDLEGTVKRTEDEVKRLEGINGQLNATIKTNMQEIAALRKDLEKSNLENDRNLKQIELYKEAIAKANDNMKVANEKITTLTEEHNSVVQQYNELGVKYKKAVEDFNDLATKWNKMQEDLSAAK